MKIEENILVLKSMVLSSERFTSLEILSLKQSIEALERTSWIPVRERWPGEVDGDKYGTVQWCVLYKGQHQIVWHEHYQWRSKDGVQTHWMRMFNLPEQEV